MLLILDSPNSSTHPIYNSVSNIIEFKPSYSHEARPIEFDIPNLEVANHMNLSYAQKSFALDWDISDENENAYWDSI